MNIILDLDGTLITTLTDNNGVQQPSPRPYLATFLRFLFTAPNLPIASVSLWTAGTLYWLFLVDQFILLPLLKDLQLEFPTRRIDWSFTRHKKDCTAVKGSLTRIKNLRKIYRHKKPFLGITGPVTLTKDNTLILDDNSRTWLWNYGNAVPIPEYTILSTTDEVLLQVIPYLYYLCQILEQKGTIRHTDKRAWFLNPYFATK